MGVFECQIVGRRGSGLVQPLSREKKFGCIERSQLRPSNSLTKKRWCRPSTDRSVHINSLLGRPRCGGVPHPPSRRAPEDAPSSALAAARALRNTASLMRGSF
ncbi:hypothetical protein OJAV_G00093700 [Oryzias javanicus]|uniref:Uncharacterized protein n=1 Tax=Oryzias javanicus TaxID=123683 RepID=A0A3S2MWX0_ORYJA|nr:hypothetical protein OJAV_G00093700 [Oryzias javanicus]